MKLRLRPSDPPTMLAATIIIEAAMVLLAAVICGALYASHHWIN